MDASPLPLIFPLTFRSPASNSNSEWRFLIVETGLQLEYEGKDQRLLSYVYLLEIFLGMVLLKSHLKSKLRILLFFTS